MHALRFHVFSRVYPPGVTRTKDRAETPECLPRLSARLSALARVPKRQNETHIFQAKVIYDLFHSFQYAYSILVYLFTV